MRINILICLLFLSIPNYSQTTIDAIHPDCENEQVAKQEDCTASKIHDYIKEYFKSQNGSSKGVAAISGYIGLDISEVGFVELSEMDLNATERQKDIIREAVKKLSYRVLFIPAEEDGLPTFQYKRISLSLGNPASNQDQIDASIPIVEEIYKVVEEMPRFPGCREMTGDSRTKKACADKKMLEFVYDNLKYPSIARSNGVEGTVVIQFIVGKDGSIIDAKIVRDIGASCGTEVKRVVESMNELPEKWEPGRQRGKPVLVQFNLPIKFRLGQDEPIVTSSKKDAQVIDKVEKQSLPAYDYRPSEEKSYQSMIDDVHILTLFVDTQKDHWEEEERDFYYDELLKSQDWLKTQANRYNQKLIFNNDHFFMNKEIVYARYADRGFTGRGLLKIALQDLNYISFENFLQENQFDFKKQKLKIVFFVKSNSRSHAFNFWSNKQVDLAIVYCRSTYGMITDQYVISHEILHQFGAWDLYFGTSQSEEQADKAKELYPNSIMINTHSNKSNLEVDDLTAWRVGWHMDVKQEYLDLAPIRDSKRETRGRSKKKAGIKFDLKRKKDKN